jgi:hypothetical protein
MGTKHSNLISEILIALSQRTNVRAWRNETGVARAMRGSSVIRYGLTGSSDILGIVGPYGKLLCIECKVGNDTQRDSQKNFERMVRERGGIYIVARCVFDVSDVIDKLETCA